MSTLRPSDIVEQLLAAAGACDTPLAEATSLPPPTFTSPDWFAAERERVFHAGWVAVARSSQVAEPTSYVTASIVGEPVVVIRDREGRLRGLSNVCRHRGTTLVDGSGSAPSLQCPNHLWTYRLDGSLAAAPSMGEGFEVSAVCLPTVAVEEWQGWVLVNVDGDAPPLGGTVTALDTLLADESLNDLVHAGTLEPPSPWNWKVSVENFAESYHHRAVHPITLDTTFPGARSFIPDSGDEPWTAVDHVSVDSSQKPFLAVVVYPSLLFAVFRGVGIAWFRLSPLSPDRCQLSIEVYVQPELVDVGPALVEAARVVNDEDIVVNRRSAEGLASRYATRGPVSPLEASCWHFRRWLLAAMRG